MNDSINLSSMAADSSAAFAKLAKDVKDLRKLLEVRALQENSLEVAFDPHDLSLVESGHYSEHVRS
jgi:hypothetical protein